MVILKKNGNIIDFKVPPFFLNDEKKEDFIKKLKNIFGEVEAKEVVEPDRNHSAQKERDENDGRRWTKEELLYLINHSHESDEFLSKKLNRSSTGIKLYRNRIYDINAWVYKRYKKQMPITNDIIKQYLEGEK